MVNKLTKGVAAAATLLVFAAAGAPAQTRDGDQNNRRQDRQPPPQTVQRVPDNRPTLPGWQFTPFPSAGNSNFPRIDPPLNIKPLNGPAAGLNVGTTINGGTTVIYQSGYPGYYGYPYGGAGVNVIVNQNPVIYPGSYLGNGPYRYESTPPITTVVETDGRGRTRMSSFSGGAFSGYSASFISGQTVLSPFGSYFGCPRYVSSRFVILGTPYPYVNGYDSNVVISPWAANDPYVTANAVRGRTLGTALKDFTLFWEQGNAAGLRRRVQPDMPVAVFNAGRFAYSLGRADFLSLAADALDQVQTVSFRFVNVRERSDGLACAYALHTYRSREDGTLRTVRDLYTLVYENGDWYLSAFSVSPAA